MARQPRPDVGVLVGPVVVEDDVNEPAGGDLVLDRVQEADELLVRVLLHAAAEHGPVEHVEGGEQGDGPVALVVVGPGPGLAGL